MIGTYVPPLNDEMPDYGYDYILLTMFSSDIPKKATNLVLSSSLVESVAEVNLNHRFMGW